jgi:hypothetical protein
MEEVDAATQAEMAIKLSDNVRDLVRMHIREALGDVEFMYSLPNRLPLQKVVFGNGYDSVVVNMIKTVITTQMNKS